MKSLIFFNLTIALICSQSFASLKLSLKCSPDNPIVRGSPYVYIFHDQGRYFVANGIAKYTEYLTEPTGKQIELPLIQDAWIDGRSVRWNHPGKPTDERFGNHFIGYTNNSDLFGQVFVSVGIIEWTENAYPYCVQFEKID